MTRHTVITISIVEGNTGYHQVLVQSQPLVLFVGDSLHDVTSGLLP